jgi:hypothetical protein
MLLHTSGSSQGPLLFEGFVLDRNRWIGLVGEATFISGTRGKAPEERVDTGGWGGESVMLVDMASLRASVM